MGRESDREKWDARYLKRKAQPARPAPSHLLRQALQLLSPAAERRRPGEIAALDVACGRGQSALWLAERGFRVIGIDISAEALRQAREAAARTPAVSWIQADLTRSLPVRGRYQLIVMVRYLNLDCLRRLKELLAPGGVLVVEVFIDPGTLEPRDGGLVFSGPANPAFLARAGEVAAACADLEVLLSREGPVTRDGRTEALCRLVARRPPGGTVKDSECW